MKPGTIAGRYRVARRLGAGGMAKVYLCWDEQDEIWCAIKVMAADIVADPVQRARFVQEARTLARLGHPHLVELFDVAEDVENPYMVMEYLPGGTVASRLTRGALHPRQAAELAADVCSALQAAHDAGVIHRDIKPQNMLLTRNGLIKVSDFGVARVEQELRLTMSNVALGTLAYMAPEQQRDAARVDHRADIYSMGATLWAMLTARRPVPLITEERKAALAVIPEALRPVLDRATSREPRQRFATARGMEAALRNAVLVLDDGSAAPVLVDRMEEPPGEPPTEPPTDLKASELRGTSKPWDGNILVPGVLRAFISDDGTATNAPFVDPPPPRRPWRIIAAVVGLLLMIGACAGVGGVAAIVVVVVQLY